MAIRGLPLLLSVFFRAAAAMERMKKPCLLGVTLLLFLLLVSAAHGAQLADAKDDVAGMRFCSSSGKEPGLYLVLSSMYLLLLFLQH